MNDTAEGIRRRMSAMMRERSGEERLRMGASMYDAARAMVLSSLRDCSRSELPGRLFLRMYGADFSAEKREKIVVRLIEAHKGSGKGLFYEYE